MDRLLPLCLWITSVPVANCTPGYLSPGLLPRLSLSSQPLRQLFVPNLLDCLVSWSSPALGCEPTNCHLTLEEPQGSFSSPCYPEKYPNSQACRWSLRAAAGFIIQLSFLDFDLEEAPGCIYDQVVVNTGGADVRFCGPTASGLTLNSTGNVMELTFTSDFSVQKRGFSVSFRHGRSQTDAAAQVEPAPTRGGRVCEDLSCGFFLMLLRAEPGEGGTT